MNIGNRIKELRESMNMSQTELASRINASKQSVYKYENGIVSNIPSDKIEAIARALETTPAYLMGWDSVSNPENARYTITASIVANSKEDAILKYAQLFMRQSGHAKEAQKLTLDEAIEYLKSIGRDDIICMNDPQYKNKTPDEIAMILHSRKLTRYRTNQMINKLQLEPDKYYELLSYYSKLNSLGQEIATEQVRLLTLDKKYTEKTQEFPSTVRDSQADYLAADAAHARTDIDIPEGTNTSDDDIMDDENF